MSALEDFELIIRMAKEEQARFQERLDRLAFVAQDALKRNEVRDRLLRDLVVKWRAHAHKVEDLGKNEREHQSINV